MPSSTSNSKHSQHRAPRGPWAYTWLIVAAVTLSTLVAYDQFLRSHDFAPSYRDTIEFWALTRDEVGTSRSQNEIVLAGSSRMLTSFDPRVVEREFDDTTAHQLSVSGSSAVPVLENLAADPDFRGTVIADVLPYKLFHRDPATGTEAVLAYLSHYENRARLSEGETRLQLLWQDFTTLGLSEANPKRVLSQFIIHRSSPQPSGARLRRDRFREDDYFNKDTSGKIEALKEKILTTPIASEEQLIERANRFNSIVDKIASRGGRVIFVRAISSGAVRRAEESRFPRERFWDPFTQRLRGAAIHFADVPGVERFECPDGSHLDKRSSSAYTRIWMRELEKRGLLP